jgi:hypothetical protein
MITTVATVASEAVRQEIQDVFLSGLHPQRLKAKPRVVVYCFTAVRNARRRHTLASLSLDAYSYHSL